jgi:hypothetical protein
MDLVKRTLSVVTAVAVGLAVLVPAAAFASKPGYRTLAPPGNSGVSQYLEVVPTDSGSAPPRTGPPSSGLPSSGQHALQHLGSAGRLLGAVVADTSQPATPSHQKPAATPPRRHDMTKWPRPTPPPSADPVSGAGHGSSPVTSVLSATTGSGGGLGWLVPAILVSSAVAVALGVVRRRTPQG